MEGYDYHAAIAAGAKPDATGHWPSKFKGSRDARLFLPSELGTFNTKLGMIVPLDTPMTSAQQETMRTEPILSSEEVSSYLKSTQDEMWMPGRDPHDGL